MRTNPALLDELTEKVRKSMAESMGGGKSDKTAQDNVTAVEAPAAKKTSRTAKTADIDIEVESN